MTNTRTAKSLRYDVVNQLQHKCAMVDELIKEKVYRLSINPDQQEVSNELNELMAALRNSISSAHKKLTGNEIQFSSTR